MTELERRALLGDREAQEECTRQGIVLPCPLGIDHKIRVYNYDPCDGYQGNLSRWRIQCECGICLENENLEKLKGKWNTRAAPPVERCGTCSLQNEQFYPLPQSEDGHYYDKLPLLGNKDTIVYIDYLGEEADHGQE